MLAKQPHVSSDEWTQAQEVINNPHIASLFSRSIFLTRSFHRRQNTILPPPPHTHTRTHLRPTRRACDEKPDTAVQTSKLPTVMLKMVGKIKEHRIITLFIFIFWVCVEVILLLKDHRITKRHALDLIPNKLMMLKTPQFQHFFASKWGLIWTEVSSSATEAL